MGSQAYIATVLFLIIYALIISEKLHRTIIAMVGAAIMIFIGALTQKQALEHIDFNTLGLLIGMMILVNITAETGVFKYIAIKSAKVAQGHPIRILILLSLITAGASAFLDNVTTVLLIVPVTFSITRQLGVNPFPFLMSEVLSSNIGGTATLIGDPPNIMIGSAVPELTFAAFITNLAPIVILIQIVTLTILVAFYKNKINTSPEQREIIMSLDEKDELTNPILLRKSLIVLGLTILGFFLHQMLHMESASIALTGAFLLLLLSGEEHLEHSLAKVEWTTIFFFVGLFVLVGGLVSTGVISVLAGEAMKLTQGNIAMTSMLVLWMSAIASAFVDNIPFVATMIPLIKEMGTLGITNLDPLWWSLSLGACLGGNGTIIGASANVIVAGLAAKEGHPFTFLKFMAIGFPLMIISIILSTMYVWLRYLS